LRAVDRKRNVPHCRKPFAVIGRTTAADRRGRSISAKCGTLLADAGDRRGLRKLVEPNGTNNDLRTKTSKEFDRRHSASGGLLDA
jgi:hypothetical protein